MPIGQSVLDANYNTVTETERQRETDRQTETERDNSNSKTLFYKDCNLGSVKKRERE